MNNRISRTEKLLMITILIAAFVIRIVNIRFGYPLRTHGDESNVINMALAILKTGDLNPHAIYPSLTIYLQALLFFIMQLPERLFGMQLFPAQPVDFHVYARALNVLFSTATVYIVYEIGRRLFGVWAGLAAMFFLAVSSAHVTHGYFATVDTPTAFWSSIVCLVAVIMYTSGERRRRHYIIGGICVGLAASSKYPAFLTFLPILVAHAHHARLGKSWLDKNIILGLLTVPIAFFMTTPYALLEFKAFIGGLSAHSSTYLSHPGFESQTATSFNMYLDNLKEGYGGLASILALIGFISLLLKKRSEALLLISVPLVFFLFLGSYKVFYFRNALPALPFLAVLSGYGITVVADSARNIRKSPAPDSPGCRYAAAGLAILLIFVAMQSQIAEDWRMIRNNTLPDTRWVSLQWIQNNIPPGTRIGREFYTPPVEMYTGVYSVTHFDMNGVFLMLENNEQVDIMIASSYDYDRFMDSPGQYPWFARIYQNFFDCNELVKEFVEDGTTMSGPTIRIFRIRRGPDKQACMAR